LAECPLLGRKRTSKKSLSYNPPDVKGSNRLFHIVIPLEIHPAFGKGGAVVCMYDGTL
jgi:hypothetical protein